MIIVTGAAGFIGSNIVYSLNKKGITDIIAVDNLKNAQKHLNLNSLKIADFIDKDDFLDEIHKIQNIKTIFHQGACSSTVETDGKYMMKNNFEYSKNLLNFSIKNNVDFLYASSASVYGNGKNGFVEDKKCEYPLNIYAYSKFFFDNYVRNLLNKVDTQILGLRYFNVYGYQENHKGNMASVAFHLFNQLEKTGECELSLFEGSKEFLRDFVFIEDIVNVNLFFYETKKSGIFNCGTGKARSFYDIATNVKQCANEGRIKFIDFPEHLEGKYQKFTQANLDNLKKIGYTKDFLSLEEGIQKYFKNFKNSKGYL